MQVDAMLRGRVMTLIGRRAECGTLDHLVTVIRAGESRVLVVSGEPGVGKTALLDYLSEQAAACRVVRATGVQSEMELALLLCISCARRCSATSTIYRRRSVKPCGPRSACARGRCRTNS
jgi:replication-associated recombination protein RarA